MTDRQAHMFEAEGTLTVQEIPGGAGSGSVELTHYLWIDWVRIAQTEIVKVREARTEILRVQEDGGNWAETMDREQTTSMVTITACAHALDGIYAELKTRVAMPNLGEGASRHDHIRAALAAAFKLSNGDGKSLKDDFKWLHDLRDTAVHPEAKSRPLEPHPITGHGSHEAARYCLESCEKAMTLLMSVLGRLADPAQARTSEVRAYGVQFAGVLGVLMPFD